MSLEAIDREAAIQGEAFNATAAMRAELEAEGLTPELARAELDLIQPMHLSPELKVYQDAMSALGRGTATPDQIQLIARTETLKGYLGSFQDRPPIEI